MNIGCGNSILPEEMYDHGYKNIYNIDISQTCIEFMAKRNSENRSDLKCKFINSRWMENFDTFLYIGEVMDIRNLSFPGGLFDLIVDKSTIDALLCGDSAYMNVAKMLKVIL